MSIAICKINLKSPLGEDYLLWLYSKNGEYSVKSGVKVLQDSYSAVKVYSPSSSFIPPLRLWRIIWEVPIMPRIKFFLWCCISEALPCSKALWSRKCASSPVCRICCKEVETIEHILILCPWVLEVWHQCPLKIKIEKKNISRFESWFFETFNVMEKVVIDGLRASVLLCYLCWFIWKARNEFIFNGIDPKVSIVISKAVAASFEYGLASRKLCQSSFDVFIPGPSRWSAPCPGMVKINCDGAFSKNLNLGVAAFVVRDHTGALVDGKTSFIYCSSPVIVEAKAIFEATMFAASCFSLPVLIESDCKVVIDAILMEPTLIPWDDIGVVEAIRDMARKFANISFSFVYREANEPAHWVAISAKCGALPLDWNFRPPPTLMNLLLRDVDP